MDLLMQKLAQLMQKRQEQRMFPYVLLLGSSLSLTPEIRSVFARPEDLEAFWEEIQSTSPTSRKALLKGPLNALGLEPGYQAIAQLAEAGYFSLILTLNVDDTLDNALKVLKTLPASEYRIWVHGEVTSQEIVTALDLPTPRVKVVKLRGDINARKLPFTPEAQFEFSEDLEQAITRWLSRDTIIVGDLLFDDDAQRCLQSGDGELWCILPDKPANDSFIKRVKRVRQTGKLITGPDAEFNTFFIALAELLLDEWEGPRKKIAIYNGGRAVIYLSLFDKSLLVEGSTSVPRKRIELEPGQESLNDHGLPIYLPTHWKPKRVTIMEFD